MRSPRRGGVVVDGCADARSEVEMMELTNCRIGAGGSDLASARRRDLAEAQLCART
jgi:hypothetical protein